MRSNSKDKYLRIQRTSKLHGKRNVSLGYELISAVKMICEEFIGNEIALVPVPYYGEALMCVKNSITYATSQQVRDTRHLFENGKVEIIKENFMDADIVEKYNYILFFPDEVPRADMMYFIKSLKCLEGGGLMVALLPTHVLFLQEYSRLRRRILQQHSLKAVFDLKNISRNRGLELSVLIIEKNFSQKEIFMCNISSNFGDTIKEYRNGEGGFLVNPKELNDRFDVGYYDPKYKKIRNFIGDKATVKLRDIADVFEVREVFPEEYFAYEGYAVVGASCIYDKEVHIGRNRFISRDFIEYSGFKRYILKKGDIVVSLGRNHDWAIYNGEDNYAVVDRDIAVIRGDSENIEWINMLFSTNVGIEYFEKQMEFFTISGLFNRVNINCIKSIHVPGAQLENIVKNIDKEESVDDSVATLFSNLGWQVSKSYSKNGYYYDLALLYENELRAVVETKFYKSKDFLNNKRIVKELAVLKDNIGDVDFYIFIDDVIFKYQDGQAYQLETLPLAVSRNIETLINEQKRAPKYKENYNNEDGILIKKLSEEDISAAYSFTVEYLMETVKNIEKKLYKIEDRLDSIDKRLEMISNQITNYQSLVKRQLDIASEDEKDRIIHAFSEECSEKIVSEIKSNGEDNDYHKELKNLKNLFGESAWNKMKRDSQTFLVSARIVYNNLVNLPDCVDYSGVCLLVTKALEVELKRRFYKDYLGYLKTKYPGRVNQKFYPTPLLEGNRLLPEGKFTLGKVAYVLCYNEDGRTTIQESENNRLKLLEYCREKLFADKSDDEIYNILGEYAQNIEEIRVNYRNPSAHTNAIRKIDADNCLDLILYVEKFMKKMLDSFE